MALDAATLFLLSKELDQDLAGMRVEKIFQPSAEEFLLAMRGMKESARLFFSLRTGTPRVNLTDEEFENPPMPPSFCMLLRKYLTGGKLLAVRALEGERILFFDFSCMSEMGDQVTRTLAAELMGRYANLVLFQKEAGVIIDVLKHVDAEASSVRQLMPGLAYTMPPMPPKPYFFALAPGMLVEKVCKQDMPVSQAILKTAAGIGPEVCRELAFRAFDIADPLADLLPEPQCKQLTAAVEQLHGEYQNGGVPSAVVREDETPVAFSFTPLIQYRSTGLLQRQYPSFSALLDQYYGAKDKTERLRQRSRSLQKQAEVLHDRALRKQQARQEDLHATQSAEGDKLLGELLAANLHLLHKGDKEAKVQNYYDGTELAIPLDPRLSPVDNSQKYFKEYKKKKTAQQILQKLLRQGEAEVQYLASVLYEVNAATTERELAEIREELVSTGYLRPSRQKGKQKKQKPQDFLRYRSSDGFLILAGRNNLQNEQLTLKTARGKDMWFHIHGAPGSHVVVMSEGQDIPLTTQNEAAMLAVWHSSLRKTPKAPVDYTLVKNIRKTGDLPLGMVLYDHYTTAYVTAPESLAQQLAEKV